MKFLNIFLLMVSCLILGIGLAICGNSWAFSVISSGQIPVIIRMIVTNGDGRLYTSEEYKNKVQQQ